ncbi:DnaB-like helicase C-terminal domain-containing protein [Neorhizobium sp. LjRoot104]|uniref:DnaB-like helicase C-terminal domain-containing protein n=1 Tax=Neorhizobium sp. LjRoot104 TaxID=3342254 RepID=UPI003ECD0EAC
MNANYRDPLPSNIEAEQAILGAILINNDALAAVPTTFAMEHFHERLHQNIYDAILRGRAVGKGMNPVTVRSFMAPEAANERVGDMTVSQYLARLVSEAVSIRNVADFADAITGYYHRRQAMSIGDDAHDAGIKAEDELQFIDRIKECRDRLTAIVASIESRNDPQETFADAIDDTLDRTSDALRGMSPVGIDPGIPEITTLTGPWQKKQLIIIGGGVKQGKSALAMQCMFNIAEKSPVGLNSGEMSRMQIIMREKARRTGISSTRQQRGSVSDNEVEELLRAGEEMKRLRHVDIDCRRLTLDQIDQKIARLIGEQGIEAFFLDHIGKIQWTGKMEYEDEFKQGQRATSILKDFAQKHDIPIIALTHLKKSTFQDYQGRSFKERLSAAMNRRPTYRDLVGNMDKDADQVLIVFQARPIVAGMEPAENSDDYPVWEDAMNRVTGKADIILSLSRESEFPRRKEIAWEGKSTSYGPGFKQAMNAKELF